MRYGLCVALMVGCAWMAWPSWAAAPPKLSGQPYAESICSTDPNIILCEDFDEPAIATCTGAISGNGAQDFQWFNSALSGTFGPDGPGRVICDGFEFLPAASYPAPQPAGSPPGGFAKRSYYGPPALYRNGGTWRGCTWGDCDRSTYDTIAGKTYKNGNPAQPHLHVRFQFYFSEDHTFPVKYDNKIFFMQPNRFLDNPSANINSGLYISNGGPAYCGGHKHRDALAIATGATNGYPGKYNDSGTPNPQYHGEYCSGEGMGNSNGTMLHLNEAEGSCPGPTWGCNVNDVPTPGRIYRISKGQWVTFEMRYVPGTSGNFDGAVTVWVEGVKIYEDFDLRTCVNKGPADERGDCVVQDFFFGNYIGAGEANDGYLIMDNLVLSTAYIGPPSASVVDTIAPSPVGNLTITVQ